MGRCHHPDRIRDETASEDEEFISNEELFVPDNLQHFKPRAFVLLVFEELCDFLLGLANFILALIGEERTAMFDIFGVRFEVRCGVLLAHA